MTRVFVVFAHPSHESYNYALLQRLTTGLASAAHEVQVSDLYEQGFDPAMTADELYRHHAPESVVAEQRKVLWAQLLIFVYPVWWWSPPAILKGWLERVVCLDFAFRYDIKRLGYAGLLEGREAVVISTGSSDPRTYTEPWQAGAHERFVADILRTAGVPVTRHFALANVHQYAPPEELAESLRTVHAFASTL